MSISRPLITATIAQDLLQVKTLLQQGHDPNERHPTSGTTSLMIAVDQHNMELAQTLIEHGAEIEALDDDGFSIIDYLLKPGSKYSKKEQQKFINLFKTQSTFYLREEAFYNIEKLIQTLNYGDSSVEEGICFGISSVAKHYFSLGLKGLTEFKTILHLFASKNAEELNKDLLAAEKIRSIITTEKKGILLLSYRERLSNCKIDERLEKFKIKKKRAYKLIDDIIKNKFTDTSYKERKKLVKTIIEYKLTKPAIAPKDEKLRLKIDALFPAINHDIFDAQINYLTQRRLKKLTKKQLLRNKLDPWLLNMRPFLQSIALYQKPDSHSELFEKRINQLRAGQSLAATFPLVSNKKEEQEGLAISYESSSFGTFSIEELEKYFNHWQKTLEKQSKDNRIKKPLHLHLHSTDHVIVATCFPENNTWTLCENTEIKTIPHGKLDVLARNVFCKLQQDDTRHENHIPIGIRVTSSSQQELNDISYALRNDQDWQKIHECTADKLKKPAINYKLHHLASHSTNTELVQQFANKQPVTVGAIASGIIGWIISAALFTLAIITLPTPPLAAAFFILSAATSLGTAAVIKRTSESDTVNASTTQKTMHDMIQETHDRRERFPAIHRDINQTLATTDASHPSAKKRHGSAMTTPQEKPLAGLFSPDHLLYCRMQKAWEAAWKSNQETYFTAEIDMIKSIKKPGFFDVVPKLFDYHKHYQAINALLTLSKEHKSSDFRGDLGKVARELNALLTSTLFKQSAPTQLYKKLKWIGDQISWYDRSEQEQVLSTTLPHIMG